MTFLSGVNGVGFVVTVLFWATVFFRHLIPYPAELTTLPERANSAVTYGFMIADVIYSLPLLFLATIGIWRRSMWGWLAGQMVNILWIYSMTVILTRDANTTLSPGGVLFLPFAIVSVWAIPFLWLKREEFGITR